MSSQDQADSFLIHIHEEKAYASSAATEEEAWEEYLSGKLSVHCTHSSHYVEAIGDGGAVPE